MINPNLCCCRITFCSYRYLKITYHIVHVGPLLHLQNGYPNMFSDFESKKFTLHYVHSFILTKLFEKSPNIDSSLRPCGTTFVTQKWVSKYAIRFWIRKLHPPLFTFLHFTWITWKESQEWFVTSFMWGHFCKSKMGIQVCSQIFNPKISPLIIHIPSFFMNMTPLR